MIVLSSFCETRLSGKEKTKMFSTALPAKDKVKEAVTRMRGNQEGEEGEAVG